MPPPPPDVPRAADRPRRPDSLGALAAVAPALLLLGASAPGAGDAPGAAVAAPTPGGAGKPIVRVTNRNDSGPGSLRDAVSQGNRRVVFDVGGTIHALERDVFVDGAFVTIDGATAPPPGITLTGRGLSIVGSRGAHDVIVRGLRIRQVGSGEEDGDGITIRDGAYNVLVEHVSIGDTADGSIDVTRGARDVTIRWSIFAKKPRHNLLSLACYGATRVTYHHNLFVGGKSRSPQACWKVAGSPPEVVADVRNNLIWDFGAFGTTVAWGGTANVIANYYYSSKRPQARRALHVARARGSRAYARGNVSQNGADVDAEGTESAPFATRAVATSDACTAAHEVVALAGARPLDAFDRALLAPVRPSCAGPTRVERR